MNKTHIVQGVKNRTFYKLAKHLIVNRNAPSITLFHIFLQSMELLIKPLQIHYNHSY